MIELKNQDAILKIHNLLPGRYVKLKTPVDTKERGWMSGSLDKVEHLVGKTGRVVKIHENIFEAVKVELDSDARFWSYKDLELVSEELEPRIFHFDISLLNTGV